MLRAVSIFMISGLSMVCPPMLGGQNVPPASGQTGTPRQIQGGPGQKDVYPMPTKAPEEVLRRGQSAYSVNCAFCHGSDAAGGEIGPNLRRSALVLEDRNGDKIAPVVHGSRAEQGMPRVDISDAQIGDIVAYLHSLPASMQTEAIQGPINILTGDAASGKEAFATLCGSCHSVTGDLKGFAGRSSFCSFRSSAE